MLATADTRRAMLDPEDWMTSGLCVDLDPDLMSPEKLADPFDPAAGPNPLYDDQVQEAKAVCAMCPVRMRCLEQALALKDRYGVRGGLDEDDRALIHKNVASGAITSTQAARVGESGLDAAAAPTPAQEAQHDGQVKGGQLAAKREKEKAARELARPELLELPSVQLVDEPGGRRVRIDDVGWLVARGVIQRQLGSRGVVRPRHRDWLCALIHRHGYGVGWKALPKVYGDESAIRKWYLRCVDRGDWPVLLEALGAAGEATTQHARKAAS